MRPPIVKEFRESSEFFEGWRCFNIIIGSVSNRDISLFFGPVGNGEVFLNLDKSEWGSLLATLGIFPSATQARKNGWGKDISLGWSEARFKKQKVVVFVLNIPAPHNKWARIKQWLLDILEP